MKKRILIYFKHIGFTLLFLGVMSGCAGFYLGAVVHYNQHPKMYDLNKDGPYVFYQNDSLLNLNYVRGNKKEGFFVESEVFPIDSVITKTCFFPLDSTYFRFEIKAEFEIPASEYSDNNAILAISDIEGGYKALRDFLVNNKVVDEKLNWIFGSGHLVFVGDFVDRGNSVTQVLWFIYKLEQDAKKQGGSVHYIIGNHELKNFQGKFESASPKYSGIAAILGKRQHELYDSTSFLGRWMTSKNSMEIINGTIFVHGGIHPDIKKYTTTPTEINQLSRKNYYTSYFPKPIKTLEEFVISTHDGISWYRGYFNDDISQVAIDSVLDKFGAKAIVVGHTIQSKVKRRFNGKVIGIDVVHDKDYQSTWPTPVSEGLLIKGDLYYRVLESGKKIEI